VYGRSNGTLRDPAAASAIRMNHRHIQDTDTLKVGLKNAIAAAKHLGEIEEGFAGIAERGDTFLIGRADVKSKGLREMTVEVSRSAPRTTRCPRSWGYANSPPPPSFRARGNACSPKHSWPEPAVVICRWLGRATRESATAGNPGRLLIESFPQRWPPQGVLRLAGRKRATNSLGLLLPTDGKSLP